ncbi:glucose-6-phosphate dehydrogenase [Arenibaculum sp.]|jgi:glucose-6-phosphate 1-dehydrogenase|uniref:glucose-6-phosphate dehydrogenase n=1 Tax=Arenibaculum sp. TaxID=2865862 RepID=UPI002E106CA8|nr:glucose-6-phosphate dehydrogenase [Arenibaculum sp.]
MSPSILPVDPFDYVVFGGTGDLSLRKLLPALYQRDRDGQLPSAGRIIAVSRTPLTSSDFRAMVGDALRRHVPANEIDPAVWQRFSARIEHASLDATGAAGWPDLAGLLAEGADRVRVFYLATSPELFGPICKRLQEAGLVSERSRVVLEKPIGRDLASARRINDEVGGVFAERQIFRIDHYLGKETVQNLLALRFANSLFEPLWRSGSIDHVQITVAETIGIENRGSYYDRSGALRDMVQNHLLQLLCLVAMEPPLSLDRESVRDEKLKTLRALVPVGIEEVGQKTVRGQYRAGAIAAGPVRGYLDETEISADSTTETFVAIKAELHNWRWAGVPFYLRTGKRLPEKVSEIVIQFRPVPHCIFPADAGEIVPNRLVVRLQPDEHIRLHLMTKDPGPGGLRLRPAALNLSFAETFKHRFPDAYERLLMDVVRGNPTLFMRRDEVEAAWGWTERILDAWALRGDRPKPYTAGTWGPSGAIAMIERDGRTWHDEPGALE